MAKKVVELYEEEKQNEADNEIAAMAKRFKVRREDVVFAVWKMGKDSVWAKLEQDVKERKRQVTKEESEQRRKNGYI